MNKVLDTTVILMSRLCRKSVNISYTFSPDSGILNASIQSSVATSGSKQFKGLII